ncbi:MAG: hypothetical protein I3273_00505 [Candidatus Moeniiplasma glomeromycotorum]|nr:hypothetical protein [Candidatus Moeniiplasma glomeromycotorum]MCE8167393.1 hypothetical protein [Candidatus Moeniiplasma glomeromycotorum]MCE8168593.1 hypothetical protein [Candidatus Moeniiplasma glomeromycotorum]
MEIKKILVGIVVILLLVGGGFLFYKVFSTKSNPTPSEKNPDPGGKLSEKELEKYLLEKRLELKKYFVFNLGNEVKTRTTEAYNNLRYVSGDLASDMAKLAVYYEKKAQKKGIGIKGNRFSLRDMIYFVKSNFKSPSGEWEWSGNNLDQKITNGKNIYIVFEKDDEFERVFFEEAGIDEKGKRWLVWHTATWLRIDAPTTKICESKEKTLELLKTDPALIGRT